MHGLGNDFVIIDARREPFSPTAAQAQRIADRHRGVGFDQLILIEPPRSREAAAFLRFLNSDGSESGACGNGTRCLGWLLMTEAGTDKITLESRGGLLPCELLADGRVRVDMGEARLDWKDVPLAEERDTLHLGIEAGELKDPVGLSMGNPHAVFFVEDAEEVDLESLGPELEHHSLFPERANIGVASLIGKDALRLRVWERGAGITLACGSGACAAAVAACRRGLTNRKVAITVDGSLDEETGEDLEIEWRKSDGHVLMTGPYALGFQGLLAPSLLGELE
ncbi:diaminopimelate epimerase [Limibacillus halophilus]|jgi:diaminopimelate epimerase